MAFHEVRFPDDISRGARGGPERRTQIVELASGHEERNASWSARAAAMTSATAFAAPTISPASSPSSRRATAGSTGSGSRTGPITSPACRRAPSPSRPGDRCRRWRDHGVPADQDLRLRPARPGPAHRQAGGGQHPHRARRRRADLRLVRRHHHRRVTFDTAPEPGVVLTAGFAFDVPVRFDSDLMDITLDIERLGSITSIPLLELRLR